MSFWHASSTSFFYFFHSILTNSLLYALSSSFIEFTSLSLHFSTSFFKSQSSSCIFSVHVVGVSFESSWSMLFFLLLHMLLSCSCVILPLNLSLYLHKMFLIKRTFPSNNTLAIFVIHLYSYKICFLLALIKTQQETYNLGSENLIRTPLSSF